VITFGFLVGEVVRRVTGRTLGTVLREMVTGPLAADFHVGHGAEHDARTADTIPGPPPSPGDPLLDALRDPESMRFKALFNPPRTLEEVNDRPCRAAEIPAVNGHGNARALARIYGALARGGELDGVRIMSTEGLARATAERCRGVEIVLGVPTRLGLGFALSLPEWPLGPAPRTFGHPGAGGSVGFADPDARIGFGYTPNQMCPGFEMKGVRTTALVDALYASLRRAPTPRAMGP